MQGVSDGSHLVFHKNDVCSCFCKCIRAVQDRLCCTSKQETGRHLLIFWYNYHSLH